MQPLFGVLSNVNAFTNDVVPVYLSQHLPWGVPLGGGGSDSCLLTQPYYIINYSFYYHIPLWVAYQLDGTVSHSLHYGYALCSCNVS